MTNIEWLQALDAVKTDDENGEPERRELVRSFLWLRDVKGFKLYKNDAHTQWWFIKSLCDGLFLRVIVPLTHDDLWHAFVQQSEYPYNSLPAFERKALTAQDAVMPIINTMKKITEIMKENL